MSAGSRSPEGSRARNGAAVTAKAKFESPKPRPKISGPTLTSTTRADPAYVTITHNPLGTTMFSNGPAKQDQPASQPRVALKPTPPKPAKPDAPALEKEGCPPKFPPAPLRKREWPPKGDKKGSLNRASSPPTVTEPAKPVVPRRPESHAGILDKGPLLPPPAKKVPREWPPRDQEKDATPETVAKGPKAPGSQPKVALKPVPKGIEARFPKRPSEERPTSLPLKPSDIMKKKLGASNERPLSTSNAGLKKVPLKPPGPIPPRPGAKPT